MSDLISRKTLLKEITINSKGEKIPKFDCDNFPINVSIKEVKDLIRKQPTAYDLDKVVEKLEEEYAKEMIFGFNNINDPFAKACSDNKACAYAKAIEIVKGGGMNEI